MQLLEAASVLVTLNEKPEGTTTPPESTKDLPSESESMSPVPSGYSDQGERHSSADTTPPPTIEGLGYGFGSGMPYRNKRHSSGSGFSRSYQSAPSLAPGSMPNGAEMGHFRNPSNDRPPSSGQNMTGHEDRDLAATLELLSCSIGSNNGSSRGTVTLPADAPPVPPLPAQYLDQAMPLANTGFINSFPRQQPESFTRGEMRRGSSDIKIDESADSGMDDDDFDKHSRARSDDDDDGVFGRMEE